jgi:hypothetical protein
MSECAVGLCGKWDGFFCGGFQHGSSCSLLVSIINILRHILLRLYLVKQIDLTAQQNDLLLLTWWSVQAAGWLICTGNSIEVSQVVTSWYRDLIVSAVQGGCHLVWWLLFAVSTTLSKSSWNFLYFWNCSLFVFTWFSKAFDAI